MKVSENMLKMPSILRSSDISKLLEVSPDDISCLARKGFLRGFKLGRQWRFRRKDILSWFKSHSKKDMLELIK